MRDIRSTPIQFKEGVNPQPAAGMFWFFTHFKPRTYLTEIVPMWLDSRSHFTQEKVWGERRSESQITQVFHDGHLTCSWHTNLALNSQAVRWWPRDSPVYCCMYEHAHLYLQSLSLLVYHSNVSMGRASLVAEVCTPLLGTSLFSSSPSILEYVWVGKF